MRSLAAAAVLLLPAAARADFVTVPLDGLTNQDLRTYFNGTNYPSAPTSLTVGGVPFALAPLAGSPGSLGVFLSEASGSPAPALTAGG